MNYSIKNNEQKNTDSLTKPGRLTYLDLVKGFGILLVVLGHIEYISEELRGFIASFHMPLFFMVSGILIAYKFEYEKNIPKTIKQIAKGILIPYMWFSVLYFFIDIMNLILNKIDMNTFIDNAISSVTFYGVSVLWFLPALFIGEVIALFILAKCKKIYLVLPVAIILALIAYLIQIRISSIYEININNLLIKSLINFIRVFLRGTIASSFVVTGYYLKKIFLDRVYTKPVLSFILGVLFLAIDIVFSQINGCIDFHYIILKNVPLFYFCAIVGSLAIILLSIGTDALGNRFFVEKLKLFEKSPFSFIEFFGKNSLVIMATHVHCYVLYAGILIAWSIDAYVTRAKSYIFLFNIMFFTMLIETIIVIIVNNFFPFVLGKPIKKNKTQNQV